VSNLAVCRHVFAVLGGRARSLLDFCRAAFRLRRMSAGRSRGAPDRIESLPRCRYERVIRRVISDRPVVIGSSLTEPRECLAGSRSPFRNIPTGQRRVFTLDELADRCAL
jgi:hypothetical protein